ncbi:brain protein I3-like [Oppia nitens]|uniref:brain protein I3-like n=1 Tax=Oppia nitens TaxID=1686743 RepID=UPI0023DA5DCC|nr:brain protein I3-like [Oppia nitens]
MENQQQWTPAQTGPAPPYSAPNQPGWAPPGGQQAYVPQQGYAMPGTVLIQQQPAPQTVVIMGGCPTCRVGHLDDEFTCLGIFCCILFFPLGLICLFTMREKRCTNCGATF